LKLDIPSVLALVSLEILCTFRENRMERGKEETDRQRS